MVPDHSWLGDGVSPSFEDCFFPLVAGASDQLRKRVCSKLYGLLTGPAYAGWENYLLQRLTMAGSQAAGWQFQVFRTVRAAFARESASRRKAESTLCRDFLGDPSTRRLDEIQAEFPDFIRITHVLIENWICTVCEFLERLRADVADLANRFQGDLYEYPVIAVEPGLSDPHHGGRCVARIKFAHGKCLIYKPRSVAPEAHFSRLVAALNSKEIPHDLRAARCWDRGEYGWMENVVVQPCDDCTKMEAFYWRAGALLGAVYLARGMDVHRENLIAAGEFPVLIDLEALWHVQESAGSDRSVWRDSVLRTGFLPQPDQGVDEAYRSSPLCRRLDCAATPPVRKDDDFELMKRIQKIPHHLPTCGGKTYPASDFIPSIQAGFRWVGEQLLGSTSAQAGFERWLQALVRCPRRRIYRSSSHYHAILRRMTSPQCLRNSHCPANSVPAVLRESCPPLNADEVQALQQLDIPRLRQNDATAEPHRPLLDADVAATFFSQVPLIAQTLTEPTD